VPFGLEGQQGSAHARRRDIVRNERGRALLVAIDRLDEACLRGTADEIRSAGAALRRAGAR
jgi:hypothetical protein